MQVAESTDVARSVQLVGDMDRTLWRSTMKDRTEDKPWIWLLIKYRRSRDVARNDWAPNLIASLTSTGKQKPILDLDVSHRYVPSSTPGHAHLYIEKDLSRWRWAILQLGLAVGGMQGSAYSLASIRRGANYVRLPGMTKTEEDTNYVPTWGWFFKRRR